MKKLSVHLIIFCTFFLHLPNTQAADVEFFDFDDYEARMASMDERDQDAEKQINRLLAPLDVPLGGNRGNLYNTLGDDDAIMKEILAESVRTARIEEERRVEQAQEAVDRDRTEVIQINKKIGELTAIVEESSKNSEAAFQLYLMFPRQDPEIEALENGEEKTRRRKKHQEASEEITQSWLRLREVHSTAKADLEELERQENTANDRFLNSSSTLEDLKKDSNI